MIRDPSSVIPPSLIHTFAEGAKKYRYKGLRCLKVPTEMALYTLVIDYIKPRTIIELGTKEGGSALWLADQMRAFRTKGKVVSIDIRRPKPWYESERRDIQLLKGNVAKLDECLSPTFLETLNRPWLVIDDSSHRSHDVLSVLRFFDKKMELGEYIIIEDGVVSDLGRADEFNGGPRVGILKFLSECEGRYGIDTGLCDFYGHNATGNPNGYLRRIK